MPSEPLSSFRATIGGSPSPPKEVRQFGEKKLNYFAPYYTASSAADVLVYLTALLEVKSKAEAGNGEWQPLTILYSDCKLSPRSLYNKLSNGWKYIIENLDPDGRYLRLRQMMTIQQCYDRISVIWKPSSHLPFYVLPPSAKEFDWKQRVMAWVEDKGNDVLELDGLCLSDEDQAWLAGLFDPVGIMFKAEERKKLRAVKG